MRRRKNLHPLRIDDVLSNVMSGRESMRGIRVFGWWYRTVPDRVARHARPVQLRRGVLTVHVSSSAWAQELSFLNDTFLAKIRKQVPQAIVQAIRYRVAKLPPRPIRVTNERSKSAPVPLKQLPEDVGRALATVHDDALREAIARAACTAIARS